MLVTYYAGAADAAGVGSIAVDLAAVSAAELIRQLGTDNPELAAVLTRCSLLVDGRAVQSLDEMVPADSRVDVLPPFAGG